MGSLACSVYKWGIQILDLVWRLAWVILGMVVVALMLLGLYKLTGARRARIKKKDEEVFQLVRQATNFLYQQHQLASREGKGGPTSCLKVRHMFDVLQQGPGWVKQVKDEIIRRCGEADILHIAVDTHSE